MAVLDDYIVAIGAGIITTGVIILFVLLARYRQLVSESTKSSQLAKNVWDSMNSRLSAMDARIIDLMAKVEVYSTRVGARQVQVGVTRPTHPSEPRTSEPNAEQAPNVVVSPTPLVETEGQILRILAQGPKTSNEINQIVGKSREHMARLLKNLFQRGLVMRNDRNKPYVYELTELGRRYLTGA